MARKRMLHPGIWTNIQVTRLSVLQRLLYIGLISNADDEGRLNGEPLYIKGIVFPHDQITEGAIEDQLKAIAKQSLIVRYRVAGKKYIWLPSWLKYQRIRKDIFNPSLFPPPPGCNEPVTSPLHTSNEPVTLEQQQTSPEKPRTKQNSPAETKTDGVTETGVSFSRSLELLLSQGVARKVAIEIAHQAPYSQILSVCKYAGQYKNPGGAIVTAFRQGWTLPKEN
jgi:hypothetical protein